MDQSETPVKVLSGAQDPENEESHLYNIESISAGWHHSMALEKLDDSDPNANGRVYTWGWNGLGIQVYGPGTPPCQGGRLGNDDYYDVYPYSDPADVTALTPILVKSGEQDPDHEDTYLENVVAISAGESHSMALDKDGYVYTWGDTLYGQLGIGVGGDYTLVDPEVTPVKVRGGEMGTEYLQEIIAISAGYWHCLAVDKEGVLWS